MDPKVLYWTAAFANMAVIVALAVRGVLQVRGGDAAGHRRSMLTCLALVVAFLVSYGLKVAFLGRENLELWSPLYVNTLRFHETCVLAMVIAGGVALHRGRALRRTRTFSRVASDPPARPATVRLHRRAGRTAIASLVLAVTSAGVVLFGMYART
jgi:uncharacterized membrane protein YozB (DUF420 family)